MKTDGLFDPIFGQLTRVLDLRAAQHGMQTTNLANANTPGYRAKELDFSEVLEEVMDVSTARLKMSTTSGTHLQGTLGTSAMPPVVVHEPPPWSLDGNSVNPEQEQVKLMGNNMMFNAVAKVTSKKLRLLKTVIEESGR